MMEQQQFPEVTSDDRLWAALGYPVALVALLALLMDEKKERPFIRYHAVQALVLNAVLLVAMMLLTATLIGAICAPFFWLVTFWPAIDAYNGRYTEIPGITDFIRGQNWVS